MTGAEGTVLSVVSPCRNEAATLPELVRRIHAAVDDVVEDLEIVFVDDGSTDLTLEVLRRLATEDPQVRVVSLSRGFGKEAAVLAGLSRARGSLVAVMDSDLQHPPELLRDLIETQRSSGADQVVAVRSREGDSRFRRFTARRYDRLLARSSDVPLPAGQGDFRLVSRRVVDAVLAMPETNRFSRGLFAWVGYDRVEVAFRDEARADGASRWTVAALVGYGIDGLLSFNSRPLRFMVHLGWAAIALFFVYLLYVLITVSVFGIETPGYVTLVAAIFFFGGLQLFSIGLLAEYMGRIYMEVKRRPHFIVREEIQEWRPGSGQR